MRKETLFVIIFAAIVLSTSAVIWSFALPVLRPLHFPHVESATLIAGPDRQDHALSPDEVSALDTWLHEHERGWGPLTTQTPSTGDAIIRVVSQKGDPLTITFWTGISGADWNDTVVVQFAPNTPFRIHSFSADAFMPLRRLIEQQPYKRSAAP